MVQATRGSLQEVTAPGVGVPAGTQEGNALTLPICARAAS